MRYVSPCTLECETRPGRISRKGLVALAPLVMVAWFAYWTGLVSQFCCLPVLAEAQHTFHTGEHKTQHAHHEGMLGALSPVTPMDHEHCPQLKSVELVPVSVEMHTESVSKPNLIASSFAFSVPLSTFSKPAGHTRYLQFHPPPNRYLRTRRLLI